jgi:hypothetical protein
VVENGRRDHPGDLGGSMKKSKPCDILPVFGDGSQGNSSVKKVISGMYPYVCSNLECWNVSEFCR